MESIKITKYKLPTSKPRVTYFKSGDPCYKVQIIEPQLGDVNIIRTKKLSDEFIFMCLRNKNSVYLHVILSGLNHTPLEPNIPTVKETFFQIKKLIDLGFRQEQILICVDPIIPNNNGLEVLKLILRMFSEFKELRLRFIKLSPLRYRQSDGGKYVPENFNILKRMLKEDIEKYVVRVEDFYKEFYKLVNKYQSIISVDKGEESLIGIRELMALGYRNQWDDNGTMRKIIEYEKGNKYKPIVEIISGKAYRCLNRCLLCPFYDQK